MFRCSQLIRNSCALMNTIKKNPTKLGRREFNSTLHLSSHGFTTRVHGFATKTNALVREILPATQARNTEPQPSNDKLGLPVLQCQSALSHWAVVWIVCNAGYAMYSFLVHFVKQLFSKQLYLKCYS